MTARNGFSGLRKVSKCPTPVLRYYSFPAVAQSDMTQTYFGRKLLQVRRPKDSHTLDKRKLFQNRESEILLFVQLKHWICKVSYAIFLRVANVIISSLILLQLSTVTRSDMDNAASQRSPKRENWFIYLWRGWEVVCHPPIYLEREPSGHVITRHTNGNIITVTVIIMLLIARWCYVYPTGWTGSNLCVPNRLTYTRAENHETHFRKR